MSNIESHHDLTKRVDGYYERNKKLEAENAELRGSLERIGKYANEKKREQADAESPRNHQAIADWNDVRLIVESALKRGAPC